MRVVVQKCLESSISVDNNMISSIGKWLMVLVGFTHGDTEKDTEFLANKVVNLRVFEECIARKTIIDKEYVKVRKDTFDSMNKVINELKKQ